ncbi:MAG: 2-oxoacid:ferredoxin oxidoreductase subunit gamma, partial [Caldiserica bacterium]|nr:2-oxoacid:ferredoxin oxidoreductase subunit gamma [Caldisericota bacterium]
MVMLGATSFCTGIVKIESLISSLPNLLTGKKELIDSNQRALKAGYEYAHVAG